MTPASERRRAQRAERRRRHKARQRHGLAVLPVVDDLDDAATYLEAVGALPRGRDHTREEVGAALAAWFRAAREKFSTDAPPRAGARSATPEAAE